MAVFQTGSSYTPALAAAMSEPQSFFQGALSGIRDAERMVREDRQLQRAERADFRAQERHDVEQALADAKMLEDVGYGDQLSQALGVSPSGGASAGAGRSRGGSVEAGGLSVPEASEIAYALGAAADRRDQLPSATTEDVARSLQSLREASGLPSDPMVDQQVAQASQLDDAIAALPTELRGEALRNVPAERLGLSTRRIVRPGALAALRMLGSRNDARARNLLDMLGIPEDASMEDIEGAVAEAQDYNLQLANMLGRVGEDEEALDLAARAAVIKESLIQLSPSYADNPGLDDTVAYLAGKPHEEAAEFMKWLGTQDRRQHEKDLKRTIMRYEGLKGGGSGGVPALERALARLQNREKVYLQRVAGLGKPGPKGAKIYTPEEQAQLTEWNTVLDDLRKDIGRLTELRDVEMRWGGEADDGGDDGGDGGGDGGLTLHPDIFTGRLRSEIKPAMQHSAYEVAVRAIEGGKSRGDAIQEEMKTASPERRAAVKMALERAFDMVEAGKEPVVANPSPAPQGTPAPKGVKTPTARPKEGSEYASLKRHIESNIDSWGGGGDEVDDALDRVLDTISRSQDLTRREISSLYPGIYELRRMLLKKKAM